MTVRELRARLFDMVEQDDEISLQEIEMIMKDAKPPVSDEAICEDEEEGDGEW